jgi:hypothetical protein
MKKALLLILLIIFPWQAIAAAERNFAHVVSGQGAGDFRYVGKHLAEHDAYVLHHHDDDHEGDDGEAHVDKSEKSVQHLNEYGQGCGVYVLLPAAPALPATIAPRLPPIPWPETFSNRTTLPPLPPPRARA